MANGDVFTVNKVSGLVCGEAFGFDVKAKLMSEEVKINPCLGFTPLRAPYNITVKTPRLFFVFHWP